MADKFFRTQIDQINWQQSSVEWLLQQDVTVTKVAHFGCSTGVQTIALAMVLGAREVIGIDLNEERINQAQNDWKRLQATLRDIEQRFKYFPHKICEEDKIWWDTKVPEFFKKELLNGKLSVEFLVQDITKPTSIRSSYYELAFCDFVLHHIWLDKARENARDDTLFAVQEMVKSVKPRGLIAAYELLQYDNRPALDFGSVFQEAGVRVFHMREYEIENKKMAEFLCVGP